MTSTTTIMTSSPPTTTAVKEIYYPPAASHFALSIPVTIGIVVASVGFLALLAIIAAFTVYFLDRKKESQTQKEERKRTDEEAAAVAAAAAKIGPTTENSSLSGDGEEKDKTESEDDVMGPANPRSSADGDVPNSSIIGPRYARMIGVNTTNINALTPNHFPPIPSSPSSSTTAASSSAAAAAKGKEKERTKSIIHLPVHVSDLGTPRPSQIHYEREDPGDEERDESGYRRGASWWHPEV